jgi:hypothetical protein
MIALLLHLSTSAWGQADPALPSSTAADRKVTVFVGGGGSWVIGGNAAGYRAGLAQRVGVDVALGRAGSIYLDADHAHQGLDDATPYFPDVQAPEDALLGGRDYLAFDVGGRLGVRMAGGRPSGVTAFPFFRFGAGAVFTDTKLEAPAFEGRQLIHSRAAAPMISMGGGAEVRVVDWLSLLPALSVQALGAADPGEVDDETEVGVEVRAQLGLDVGFNF